MRHRSQGLAVLATAVLLISPSVYAQSQNGSQQSVHGYSLYLGVVPAEIIRGHAQAHEETTMHGGAKSGDSHHVMVSIIDQTSGKQIENAVVEASVGELGLSITTKKLEAMRIAGTTTYGNFFPMSGPGPFRIDVEFRPTGTSRKFSTTFDYSHPSYANPR